jgi:uncharacterized repeat protein (TIGR03806 family)
MRLAPALALVAGLALGCGHAPAPTPAPAIGPNAPGAPTVPGSTGALEPPQLNFPIRSGRGGSIEPVRAFPHLRFDQPLFLTHPPDGTDRIFVLEQPGRILTFVNDDDVAQAKLFLDLTAATGWGGGETGLLGLAFDPDYVRNGFFYVNYTRPAPLRTVIARFTVSATDPDRADPASEAVLLVVPQPYQNHNGGMLAFGPDGMLYVALGDGGSAGDPHRNAQNLQTLLGKVLRIDPHRTDRGNYGIPPSNPFVMLPAARHEIWAYGLRNPWRFSFDRATGALWLGDVGQDEREEIDVVVRGGNYGWNVYEGDLPYDNSNGIPPEEFERPVAVYGHTQGLCVIGGYVYRGARHTALRGQYFCADNSSGTLWTKATAVAGSPLVPVAQLQQITSFGEDRDGEIYVTIASGEIRRLQPKVPDVEPPFPLVLSATGIFRDTAALIPADGLVEYHVNAPLWSDGATKRRWLAATGGALVYAEQQPWSFPIGTVLIKHFELPLDANNRSLTRRLETRVLIHEEGGWAGYTYVWNDAQTDAELLIGSQDVDYPVLDASGAIRMQRWSYPSRAQCMICHNTAVGSVLGVTTRQMHKPVWHRGALVSQLEYWNDLRLFHTPARVTPATPAYADPADPTRPLDERARSYFGVNCASCHQPDAPGRGTMDLRHGIPRASMNIEWFPALFGDLGVPGGLLVWPSWKERSVLWERMRSLGPHRMPAIGSNVVDETGVNLIGSYIDSLR